MFKPLLCRSHAAELGVTWLKHFGAPMFTGLDWHTPAHKIGITDHWRIILSVIVCIILAFLIWHACFPHTLWFIKLWMACATGATAGMAAGIIWQLRRAERRAVTSGRFIALATPAWAIFAAISLIILVPDLSAQEHVRTQFRSLEAADIAVISIRIPGHPRYRIEDSQRIATFVKMTKDAELFYPSHEPSTLDFQLTVCYRDGDTLQYEGSVREYHPDDLSLAFRSTFMWNAVIIPGGRRWLSNVLQEGAR